MTIKEQLTDEDYANCRRHGGVANIINCWECSAEFKDDDNETEEDEEDET
jgi:hypothetical protein